MMNPICYNLIIFQANSNNYSTKKHDTNHQKPESQFLDMSKRLLASFQVIRLVQSLYNIKVQMEVVECQLASYCLSRTSTSPLWSLQSLNGGCQTGISAELKSLNAYKLARSGYSIKQLGFCNPHSSSAQTDAISFLQSFSNIFYTPSLCAPEKGLPKSLLVSYSQIVYYLSRTDTSTVQGRSKQFQMVWPL